MHFDRAGSRTLLLAGLSALAAALGSSSWGIMDGESSSWDTAN